MNITLSKLLIGLIIVVTVTFILGLVLEFWRPEEKKPGPLPESVRKQESQPNNYVFDETGEETARREYLLGELINKLPRQGNNFTLSYDFSDDNFILSLGENEEAGNRNFESFLRQNNIEDKSWIKNLKIVPRP